MYDEQQAIADTQTPMYMWYLLSDGKWYHLMAKEYSTSTRVMKFVQQLPPDNPHYNKSDEEENYLRMWVKLDDICANANFGCPVSFTDVKYIDGGKVCAGDNKVNGVR